MNQNFAAVLAADVAFNAMLARIAHLPRATRLDILTGRVTEADALRA